MPNKASGRHPALQVQLRDKLQDVESQVESVPGWTTFTWEERKVVMVSPFFSTAVDAVRYAMPYNQKPNQWWDKHIKKKPQLKAAVVSKQGIGQTVYRDAMEGLMGKAFLRLEELLEPGMPKNTQMEAIKHLHKLVGMTEDSALVDARKYINSGNITMFKAPAPAGSGPHPLTLPPVEGSFVDAQNYVFKGDSLEGVEGDDDEESTGDSS